MYKSSFILFAFYWKKEFVHSLKPSRVETHWPEDVD